MDIFYFLKILWQRKWMLIIVSLSAVCLTFFLVGLLKPTFSANTILSTGIAVRKNIRLSNEDPFVQKYEIVSAFSSLTTTMKSRTSIRLLSFRMLLHDFNSPNPFREFERSPDYDITSKQENEFIRFLRSNRDSLWAVQLDQEQNVIFNQMTKALQYDYRSLKEGLNIYRMEETDYLNVEFKSENPELCEFAVNQFCHEFLKYNFQRVNQDEGEAVNFYGKLARDKRIQLNQLDRELSALKEDKKIVNLDEQTKAIVGQMSDLEIAKEESKKEIPGLRKAILLLDKHLEEYGLQSKVMDEQMKFINEGLVKTVDEIKQIKIAQLDTQINEFTKKGGQGNLDKTYFPEEANRDILIDQFIRQLSNNKIDLDETLVTILDQRIQAEVNLALAEESVKSLDEKIRDLKSSSTDLISVEAKIKVLEGQREMALQEYLQANSKLNDAKVIAQSSLYPITVFEYAQIPEEPQPSRRLMYSAFAGAAAGGMFTFLLFLLTLFDNTLSSPTQFEKLIPAPLLGALVRIPNRKFNYHKIFNTTSKDKSISNYKEALRRIRQKMETSGSKRFLVTSTDDKVDRSATILSLAHSFNQKRKSVLIVDTNFKHNVLSNFSNLNISQNPLISNGGNTEPVRVPKKLRKLQIPDTAIHVLGNEGSSDSPSEILADKDFGSYLQNLESNYDYILMEAPGLNEYSDARELTEFAEKVLAIFEAQSIFKEADKESIEFLNGLDDQFLGCILQDVEAKNLS